MSNILHPYKGYLNTTFSVYNDGPSKEAFTIQKNIDSSIVKSIEILPHVCFKISFSEPGKYKLLRNGDVKEIDGFSFLTFSPDGDYFALSKQGYIAWNNGMNKNWGHQPSCLVSIRSKREPNKELARFEDLSDCGIEGLARKQNVASVSFSNNNESVMMVGADGVIIIRRLNLTQKFPPLCQF